MNILNPYTWLIGAFVLALVGGSGYLYGRTDGRKLERVEWQAKEIQATQEVIDQRDKAIKDKADTEHAHQAAMLAASKTYQEGLKHERDAKDRALAAVRSGSIRLRDPGTKYTLGPARPPGNDPAARRCDAAKGADLSDSAAEFLISLASEADEATRQLTACQKQLADTYRLFGPK